MTHTQTKKEIMEEWNKEVNTYENYDVVLYSKQVSDFWLSKLDKVREETRNEMGEAVEKLGSVQFIPEIDEWISKKEVLSLINKEK